jgi:hypothetical protein
MPNGLTCAQPNFTISQDFGQLTFAHIRSCFRYREPLEKDAYLNGRPVDQPMFIGPNEGQAVGRNSEWSDVAKITFG